MVCRTFFVRVYFVLLLIVLSGTDFCFAQNETFTDVGDADSQDVITLFDALRSDLQVEKNKIESFGGYFSQLNDLLKDDQIPKSDKLVKLKDLVGSLDTLLIDDSFIFGLSQELREKIDLLIKLVNVFVKAEDVDFEKMEKNYELILLLIDTISGFLYEQKILTEKTSLAKMGLDNGELDDEQDLPKRGIDIFVKNPQTISKDQDLVSRTDENLDLDVTIDSDSKQNDLGRVGKKVWRATVKTLGDVRRGGVVFGFASHLLKHKKRNQENVSEV